MAVNWKKPKLADEFKKLTSTTRMIFNAFVDYIEEEFGKDVTVTSIYRKFDKGVHKYYRGVDIRVNARAATQEDIDAGKASTIGEIITGPWSAETLSFDEAMKATETINRRYVYDAERPEKQPVIFGADLDPTLKHIDHAHLQGHRHTRLAVSMQPDLSSLDKHLNIAEDFVEERPLIMHKASKADIAWMTARRVGKVAVGCAVEIGLKKIGLDLPTGSGVAGYLAAEKAVNASIERATGKKNDLDPISLLMRLLEAIIRSISNLNKNND